MAENSSADNFPAGYEVPKVWTWDKGNGGQFANINRPIAGPTHDKELPVGKHPLQLYSLATPNGQKVSIMLEELLAAGHKGAEYDAWLIKIGEGDQFGSGFVGVNPNSKIPALMDHSTPEPTRVFESGSILVYLAEKFGAFLPKEGNARTQALNWLFWQMGSAPSSAAVSAISTPTPRSRSNMLSTVTPWKLNASLTCLTVIWPTTVIWRARNIRLPTWPSGRGMARSRSARLMAMPVLSLKRPVIRTLCAGRLKSANDLRSSAA